MYMGEHLDKHKEKIRKLLELSMSDNPNEAETALRHAMALMNIHNITKEEVYGQKLIQRAISTKFRRMPDWYLNLHSWIAEASATFPGYRNARRSLGFGYVSFTGRERDVENAIYLFEYVGRALESNAAKFRKKLKLRGHASSSLAQQVKLYRAGFSKRIHERLKETRRQFFSEQSSSNSLVCVDDTTRKDEAEVYFMKLHPYAKDRVSNAQYSWLGFDQGKDDAEDLPLNNAVNQQNEILGVEYACR